MVRRVARLGAHGSALEAAPRHPRGVRAATILAAHYRTHPEARLDLSEVAIAAAELDANPLAGQAELITRAAREVTALTKDPTSDDVLLYAAALSAAALSAAVA